MTFNGLVHFEEFINNTDEATVKLDYLLLYY